MLPQSPSSSFRKEALRSGAKYGAIAGLIATWSISTAIAASELGFGIPISTFYAVMGMSLGAGSFSSAAYIGFGLHLLTGTVLGAIIGLAMSRFAIMKFLNPYKAVAAGIGAGIVVWLVLFLPVTALLVQPSISRISFSLAQSMPLQSAALGNANQFVWGIAFSAIAFHLVWGAIFGYMISAFLRIRAFRAAHPKGEGGVTQ
jgi:hypothetical protein